MERMSECVVTGCFSTQPVARLALRLKEPVQTETRENYLGGDSGSIGSRYGTVQSRTVRVLARNGFSLLHSATVSDITVKE